MNVDPRCCQPIARATAGRGSILLPQPCPNSAAPIEAAPPAPGASTLRINFAIAVCLVSSLLILLAGPEFISI